MTDPFYDVVADSFTHYEESVPMQEDTNYVEVKAFFLAKHYWTITLLVEGKYPSQAHINKLAGDTWKSFVTATGTSKKMRIEDVNNGKEE